MAIDFNNVPAYVRDELALDAEVARGARGMTVRRVQEWLTFHDVRVEIDGIFGGGTAEGVRRFQADPQHGLPVTGIVDEATWARLVGPLGRALREPQGLAHLSPEGAVEAVARQHLDEHPVELGGDNRGPWVRLYCYGHDGPDFAWCAGFVSMIMQQAYFYRGKTTPIAGSLSCDLLATQGKQAQLFVAGADLVSGAASWDSLGACALFLRRRTSDDWVHTGFVVAAEGAGEDAVFDTIEGNTNLSGSREGFEACARVRSMEGVRYDFVRFR